MSEQKINPKVVLEAANMAEPGRNWVISDGIIMDDDMPRFYTDWFEPLTSDDDAMKLERALKRRGNGWWSFFVNALGLYMATSAEGPCESQYDESDTLLLLKCVAAMKSLELFGEGE